MRPGRVEVYRDWLHSRGTEWEWVYYAPNGKPISRSEQPYERLRDVSRSLELAFPGYRLLDQAGALDGPEWWLYGLEATCPEAYQCLPEDLVLGIGMRGTRIPVQVPAGVNLSSRR